MHRPQFSLKTLLWLMLCVAITSGAVAFFRDLDWTWQAVAMWCAEIVLKLAFMAIIWVPFYLAIRIVDRCCSTIRRTSNKEQKSWFLFNIL